MKDILVVMIVLFYCAPLADMLVTSSIILRVYQIPYISFILNTFIIFFYDEMVLFFFMNSWAPLQSLMKKVVVGQ